MTPLRQALSEALEKFDDTPGRPCYICGGHSKHDDDCLYRVARELLPALDASATTARETPATLTESEVEELDERLEKANAVFSRRIMAVVRAAALPSSPPAAPPATPDDYERGFQAGWNHSLHLLGPQQDVAQRRAETPTNRPPADAKEWTCDECGNDLLWCKHGRKAAALPSSPPAAPPATECVNWDECSHGVVPCREFGCLKVSTPAQRRAETPTLRPNRFDCIECGPGVGVDEDGCCRTCGQDTTIVYAVPSPAPPEGPRDVAPATCEWTEDSGGYWTTTCGKLFTQGSHYRFCPYCGKRLIQVAYVEPVEPNDATGATP